MSSKRQISALYYVSLFYVTIERCSFINFFKVEVVKNLIWLILNFNIHCINIYKVVNCKFWTSAEANLGYNVQNIDATRKSVIYKNFSLTKIGI